MTSITQTPLDWIRVELIPLPGSAEAYPKLVFWWNPEKGLLEGEVDLVKNLIDEAMSNGTVSTQSIGTVEITNPFQKPTELAAILGQFYWMIPQPVSQAFENLENDNSNQPNRTTLH